MNDGIYKPALDDLVGVYQPESWLKKVALINQFILKKNVLFSVLSENGGGKSTFCKILQAKLDKSITPYLITADRLFKAEQFINQLCNNLDIAGDKSIANIVLQINIRQKHVAVVVDNAQWLSEEIIAQILEGLRSQQDDGYLHFCLSGDYSMLSTMSKLEKNEYKGMLNCIEISGLTESETKEYVLQKMHLIPDISSMITNESFQRFYELTEGSIVGINTQMLGFLGGKTTANKKRKNTFLPYVGIMGLAVVSTSIAYMMHNTNRAHNEYSHVAVIEAPVIHKAEVVNDVVVELSLVSEIPNYHKDARHQLMNNYAFKRAELLIQEEIDENQIDDSLVVMDSVIPVPKLLTRKAEENKIATEKIASIITPKESVKSDNIKYNFTVQILASHDLSELDSFIKRYHLESQAKIKVTKNKGIDWYVVTMGSFANMADAKLMVSKMPKDLTKYKPWIRDNSCLKSWG